MTVKKIYQILVHVLSLMYVNLLNVRKLYQHLNVLVQLFITDRG